MRSREVLVFGLLALTLVGWRCGEDHATSEPDGSMSEPDGSTPEPDGSTQELDGSTSELDGSTSKLDGSTQDVTLESLSLLVSYDDGELTNTLIPEFDSSSTYTLEVGYWLNDVTVTVTVNARPTDDEASITVSVDDIAMENASTPITLGLSDESKTITIGVTALDGTKGTYTINVNRASEVEQQAYAKASNTGGADNFGYAVSLWGDTLAVGAWKEDSAETNVATGDDITNGAKDSGAVYIFTRSSTGTWEQQACLKASDIAANAHFGQSVSLWGDTLAVGANDAVNVGKQPGAVYVFTRSGGEWSDPVRLNAEYKYSNSFGWAVSLWDDTLAVGARRDSSPTTGVNPTAGGDDLGADSSGAVYVFTRSLTSPTGWEQQAYIKSSNSEKYDNFGYAVSLWENTLAVGAWQEDTTDDNNEDDNTGAVYVFTRVNSTWTEQKYISGSGSGANSGDRFGNSVSLWGDTLAVGAYNQDGSETDFAGAVYVFHRTSTESTDWTLETSFNALDDADDDGDFFGNSVSLWGDTLAVGAYSEDRSNMGVSDADDIDDTSDAYGSGAVYVYSRNDTTGAWEAQDYSYIKASNTGGTDNFGWAVSLWGDTLAVGAWQEDSSAKGVYPGSSTTADDNDGASDSGAVYIFR